MKIRNKYTCNFRAFTMLELLVVIAIIGILIALLLPAVQAAREAARKLQCANNLAQIGLAVKQFEQARGMLPAGTTNETGPIRNVPIGNHLGWIPRILPYMEQTPLYEKIDFSKGVYDPANQPVWITQKPSTFSCPSCGVGALTINSGYMACSGSEETPIDTTNNGVFFLNSKLRSRDIPDGASHTIWLGESLPFEDISPDRYRYGSIKIILPKTEESDDADSFVPQAQYVYGGLGWMSGTPGTIRNTANPINTFVAPFANWPMPFGSEGNWRGMEQGNLNTEAFPWDDKTLKYVQEEAKRRAEENRFSYNSWSTPVIDEEEYEIEDEMESDDATEAPAKPDPAVVWKDELPGQFLVGGFGAYHVYGANFLLGDGQTRFINSTIDLSVYHNLGSRNDGQSIQMP